MANEEDSAITFETFRKFQRKEKKNEKLQELPEDFFKTCVEWINTKQKRFDETNDTALLKEIENVKSIVSDIFERRRKKILLLALHSVRSKKVSKNLLPEEEEFFESTVKNLRGLEENLLEKVLEGEKPTGSPMEEETEGKTGEEGDEKNDEDAKDDEEKTEEREDEETAEDSEKTQEEDQDRKAGDEDVETRSLGLSDSEDAMETEDDDMDVGSGDGQKLIRLTEEVERFMATDDNEYGPLEEGDIVSLPNEVADLLIEKDKAKQSDI